MRCVDVVVDRSGRLGALSYQVPGGVTVNIGDAVSVPFGRRQATGIVVGEGRPEKATREITSVWGARSTAALVHVAESAAVANFSTLAAVAHRLGPPDGKDATPLDAGPVLPGPSGTFDVANWPARAAVACDPGADPIDVAAAAAQHLAEHHQVLVICPTRAMVAQMLRRFESGAARLESTKGLDAAAWAAFRDGTLRVAVGTRASVLWAGAGPAAVVVVDEAHPGLTESAQPYTHAARLAAMRTSAEGSPLVLISNSVPTGPALGSKVKMATAKGWWPTMRLIDSGELPPEDRLTPPEVVRRVRRHIEGGGRPVVVCDPAYGPWRCAKCSTIDTGVADVAPDVMRATTDACRRCGETARRRTGWPAERVRGVHGELCQAVTVAELPKVRDAGLVVLGDLDRQLNAARFDGHSAAANLIVTAARAAGPDGTVVGVTRDGTEPLWAALFGSRDLTAAARLVWSEAKEAGVAPFSNIVWIRTRRSTPPDVTGWPGRVWGPRAHDGEWEVVVTVPKGRLDTLAPHVEQLRATGKVRIWVE